MSNEIVLHASNAEETSSGALVVGNSGELVILQQSNQLVEKLRNEREEHRHKQIWIKDPHGGPYRKVSAYSDRKYWSKACLTRSLSIFNRRQKLEMAMIH
jgi:hypothetical protein